MKNTSLGPGPKNKDTSLPGREEEVIVNEQEQTRIINTDDVEHDDTGERRFKEGLQDNSNTINSEPEIKKD